MNPLAKALAIMGLFVLAVLAYTFIVVWWDLKYGKAKGTYGVLKKDLKTYNTNNITGSNG